jgi:hypothetical protein
MVLGVIGSCFGANWPNLGGKGEEFVVGGVGFGVEPSRMGERMVFAHVGGV